ncbi:MAG: hypothetical protein M1470_06830 [Bacteroidetes bacterium]|nr:hypothetical protein [Bacteroidota bacterium]
MINIRNRIAVRYAVNRAGHIKRVLNFNDAIKTSETAIFLMPRMSMEFYLARSVVESFMRYFRRGVLLVTENMRELATYRSEVIVVSQADESWLKLPKHELISRLRHENFDIAFDLTFSDDVFMSYLCRKSEAKMSVGFSKTNSDHFYDLQIRMPGNGDMKRAYESLTNTIKMFKEK